jgi:hypothetical protein
MGGALTIAFTSRGVEATHALVNDVLRHITYENSSSTPPGTVTMAWTFSDAGGQGSGGALSSAGTSLVTITSADQPVLLPTEDIENSAPSLAGAGAIVGDGNGDGVQDSAQASVASVEFTVKAAYSSDLTVGDPVFATLVSGSLEGKANASDAVLTEVKQLDASADMPDGMKVPLGLISFKADITQFGTQEIFSLYADPALGANGYWVQDPGGTWINLASEAYGGQMVTEGGKLRLDFAIEDGGQFDADGAADGSISNLGTVGNMAQSIYDHQPMLPLDYVWFW